MRMNILYISVSAWTREKFKVLLIVEGEEGRIKKNFLCEILYIVSITWAEKNQDMYAVYIMGFIKRVLHSAYDCEGYIFTIIDLF